MNFFMDNGSFVRVVSSGILDGKIVVDFIWSADTGTGIMKTASHFEHTSRGICVQSKIDMS